MPPQAALPFGGLSVAVVHMGEQVVFIPRLSICLGVCSEAGLLAHVVNWYVFLRNPPPTLTGFHTPVLLTAPAQGFRSLLVWGSQKAHVCVGT